MKSLTPDVPGAPSSTEWVQGIAGPLDEVAGLILDHQLVDQWVDGAIFPCELAFFLATCRMRHVEAIIESGRQDGYSTLVLGYFAQRYNVSIYSIDREIDRDRAQRCRKRLQGLPVQLLVGDAYDLVGRQLDLLADRTTALLIDGPKGWAALSMIAAAMRPRRCCLCVTQLNRRSTGAGDAIRRPAIRGLPRVRMRCVAGIVSPGDRACCGPDSSGQYAIHARRSERRCKATPPYRPFVQCRIWTAST